MESGVWGAGGGLQRENIIPKKKDKLPLICFGICGRLKNKPLLRPEEPEMKRILLFLILTGAILSTSTVFAADWHVPSQYPIIHGAISEFCDGTGGFKLLTVL